MSALTVKAVLTGAGGTPASGTDVQVRIFPLTGEPKVVGEGKTDDKGQVNVVCGWQPTADYQPRLQLLVRTGTTFSALSENPQSFTSGVADYGPLVVKPAVTPVPKLPGDRTSGVERPEPAPSSDTPLDQVFTNVLDHTQRVHAAQRAKPGALRLGNVSVRLKVLPGSTPGTIKLPQVDELAKVGGEALSEVSFEVDGEEEARGTKAEPWALPQVTGFTEPFARRKLAEGLLQVEVVYQLVAQDEQVGRVMLQVPKAGAPLQPGSLVTLSVGRKG